MILPWPVEQAGVEVLFQLLDLEGDRRLGHVEVLCRAGEGPVLRHRVEYLESAICHDGDKYDLFCELKHSPSPFGQTQETALVRRSRQGFSALPRNAENHARTRSRQLFTGLAQDHHDANRFAVISRAPHP